MKTAILQLTAPSAEAKRVMADLGLEFYNSSGKMKSFAEIGEMLRTKLGHLNDQSKLLVMSTIAGQDGIRFLSQLSETSTQSFEKMRQAMSNVSAEETAKTRLESLTGQWQKFRSEVGIAAGNMMESAVPAMQELMKSVSGLVAQYNALSPETKTTITNTVLVGTAALGTGALLLGLVRIGGSVVKIYTQMTAASKALAVASTAQAAAQTAANAAGAAGAATTAGSMAGLLRFINPTVAVLSLVAAGFVAYKLSAAQAAEEARKFAQAQSDLNRSIQEAATTRDSSKVNDLQKQSQELDQLARKYDELKKKQTEVNASGVTPGKGSLAAHFDKDAEAAQKLGEELDAIKKRMAELGVTTGDYQSKADALRSAIYGNTRAIIDNNKAEIDQAVQIQDTINKINESAQVYRGLADEENVSAQQKEKLAGVVKVLTDLIPGLNTQEMANGKVIVTNTSLIGDKIRALMQEKGQAVDTANTELSAAKAEAEARVASYTTQIESIQALAAARNALVGKGQDVELPDNFSRREQAHLADLNDGISVGKANLAEIDAAFAKIKNGTGYTGPTGLNGGGGGGDQNYNIPGAPKKGDAGPKEKTAEQLAQDAENALRDRYQKELAMERQRFDTGQYHEGSYAEALKRIRTEYNDFLTRNDSERYSLENEAARMGFEHSRHWIEQTRQQMEDAGKSEIEILQMEEAAWERVTARKIANLDQQRQAQDELRRVQQALVTEMEASLKKARDLDAQESITAAEADARNSEKKVQDKIDALNQQADATNRLLEYERERAKLSELEAQRNATASDKRFELISRDANGNLVRNLVADLPKLAEIDKQIADQKTKIGDMQRDDETKARRAALDKELKDTQDANQKKLTALHTYWDAMTSQEQITQDLRDSIVKNGMDNTTKMVDTYLGEMLKKYEATRAALMAPLGSSPSGAGGIGPYGMSLGEAQAYNARKDAWETASDADRARLSTENQQIRDRYGFEDTGKIKFHTGVDRVPGPLGMEVPAILQAGERVLSIRQNSQFENLMTALSSRTTSLDQMMQSALTSRMADLSRIGGGSGVVGGPTHVTNNYSYNIAKVEANNIDEFIESVRKF